MFANRGLATIAIKKLISYGEAVNNDFAAISV